MFFGDWNSLLRTILAATIAYFSLIIFLRLSGKRTLTQLNMFDFVITVAFGSTLATTILSQQTPIFNGLAALLMLVVLQYVVALIAYYSKGMQKLIKSQPRMLFYKGEFIEAAMKKERIPKEEILQAIRSQGMKSLEQTEAVVLETNGKISVISYYDKEEEPTLKNVNKGPGL